jgi:hypothetical protein
VALQIKQTVSAVLALDGTPTAVSLTPGQDARYTFSGTVGHYWTLNVTGAQTTPAGSTVTVKFISPQGTELGTCYVNTNSGPTMDCDLPRLPSTGTYTVYIDSAAMAVTMTLGLSQR